MVFKLPKKRVCMGNTQSQLLQQRLDFFEKKKEK